MYQAFLGEKETEVTKTETKTETKTTETETKTKIGRGSDKDTGNLTEHAVQTWEEATTNCMCLIAGSQLWRSWWDVTRTYNGSKLVPTKVLFKTANTIVQKISQGEKTGDIVCIGFWAEALGVTKKKDGLWYKNQLKMRKATKEGADGESPVSHFRVFPKSNKRTQKCAFYKVIPTVYIELV